jgi:hypothetical protein
MFTCQLCGAHVPRGVPRRLVVTLRRPRIYSARWTRTRNTPYARDHYDWRDLPRSKNGGRIHGKPRYIEVLIPQHTGWEIAREKAACPACASSHRYRSATCGKDRAQVPTTMDKPHDFARIAGDAIKSEVISHRK